VSRLWHRSRILALALAVALGALAAAAQAASGQNASGQNTDAQAPSGVQPQSPVSSSSPAGSEPEPSAEQNAPVPVLIDGAITSLALSSELERTNYLSGGVGVGATYDDNILSATSGSTGGFSFSLMPFIALDQSRARMHWNLSYAAGFVANQHLDPQTQYAHNLGAELDYRLSPHVNLRLRDHFSITTNFYDQLILEPTLTGSGPLQQPNQSVITPLAKQISNLATAEITYQFSPGDMVGASGAFYNLSFRDVPVNTLDLLDTETQAANAFYSHRLSPRNWIGATYGYQRLSFDPAVQQAYTHSFLVFDTLYLSPKATLSLFAGPEFSQVDSNVVSPAAGVPPVFIIGVPLSQRRTLASGGVIFSWQGERNNLQMSASRRVSDGGGVLGAVELNSLSLGLRHRMARSTTLSLGAIYGDNTALGALASSGAANLQAAAASAAIEQQLRPSLVLTLGYARDYQRESGIVSPPADVNHNRGWVSLTWSFTRPLGQ